MKSWELEAIQGLQLSITVLISSIGIDQSEIIHYSPDSFKAYFEAKKLTAPQSAEINVFIDDLQKGIEKYTEQIKKCAEEFKPYL